MCAQIFLQVDYVTKKVGDYKFSHLVHFSYEGLFVAENSRGWPSLIMCNHLSFCPEFCSL